MLYYIYIQNLQHVCFYECFNRDRPLRKVGSGRIQIDRENSARDFSGLRDRDRHDDRDRDRELAWNRDRDRDRERDRDRNRDRDRDFRDRDRDWGDSRERYFL